MSGPTQRPPALRATDPTALAVEEGLAALGTLVAGVAHEINNPITYVIGNLGELERLCRAMREALAGYRAALAAFSGGEARADDLERKVEEAGGVEIVDELIGDALEGAHRIREVVRDLLRIAHPSERGTAPVDVHDILDSTLRLIGRQLGRAARLEKDYRATRRVDGDRARLAQVCLNLIANAMDACQPPDPERHRIGVRTRDTDDGIEVEISDTGPGVPEHLRERIFESFYTTKPVGSGTGLGLFISRRIVEEHGGRLELAPSSGAGACFRVFLPGA